MILRPYQDRSCDAMIDHIRKSISPAIIDAAPAAGKSYMIARLADVLHKMSGKKVLCLAPSSELIKQNIEKFRLTGHPASMFSASAGPKDLRHHVVFGSPLTVKNKISRFKEGYCAVIIDEVHGLTPTIKSIIESMRQGNPNLRVIGLTGTPYRLGSGYIFRQWPDGKINGDDKARDPYFSHCVYQVSAREMLEEKYITPMVIGEINSDKYDTSGIKILPNGHFNPSDVEQAFEGHGRKTASIVADVVQAARCQVGGVMLFAATIQHAHEIMASLPPENSAIVTGDECSMMGRKAARTAIIEAYRAGRFRYLVSVGTLTTGFDVSHTAIIALLRFTESASLLLQILGRAWRLCDGKSHSLLLDYAGNVEKHFPDGDIYKPEIRAGKAGESNGGMSCICPTCSYENTFSANPQYLDYKKDEAGYILDLDGQQVQSDWGPIAGHYGRRCMGMVQSGPRGEYLRCGYRWTAKECPHCLADNDIAARYCCNCRGEIVDPNERLVMEFKALKKDPTKLQTDKVISMTAREGVSQKGNKTITVQWVTEYRNFTTWFLPEAKNSRAQAEHALWANSTDHGQTPPRSVTYQKDADSGFFRIAAYDREPDLAPA